MREKIYVVLTTRKYEEEEYHSNALLFSTAVAARDFIQADLNACIKYEKSIDKEAGLELASSNSPANPPKGKQLDTGKFELEGDELFISLDEHVLGHEYTWALEECDVLLPVPAVPKPIYIALYRSSAVRDVQVYLSCGDGTHDPMDDNAWADLEDAKVYIGCFEAENDSEEALEALRQKAARYASANSDDIMLIPANKEDRQ